MFSGSAKLKSDRKIKLPPSPLDSMVENKIELEDYKITIQLDESFCDTNSVRPFINCLRHILQETKEQKRDFCFMYKYCKGDEERSKKCPQ